MNPTTYSLMFLCVVVQIPCVLALPILPRPIPLCFTLPCLIYLAPVVL